MYSKVCIPRNHDEVFQHISKPKEFQLQYDPPPVLHSGLGWLSLLFKLPPIQPKEITCNILNSAEMAPKDPVVFKRRFFTAAQEILEDLGISCTFYLFRETVQKWEAKLKKAKPDRIYINEILSTLKEEWNHVCYIQRNKSKFQIHEATPKVRKLLNLLRKYKVSWLYHVCQIFSSSALVYSWHDTIIILLFLTERCCF